MAKITIKTSRFLLKLPVLMALLVWCCLTGCRTQHVTTPMSDSSSPVPQVTPTPVAAATHTLPDFFFGLDLSYTNEVEDCGAVYHVNGAARGPFDLFAERGANLVRARLWHNPTWTQYSTLDDVQKTFHRAQDAGMHTLLTIHYSDDWADPAQQRIPDAWKDITDTAELSQAVYDYTRTVLLTLHESGVLPDFVQVGNETNGGLLKEVMGLDWPRDAQLFNAGIRAIRDVTAELGYGPQIVLHVAQPENTGWWFNEAVANGVTDFDVIGISYYPQWSRMSVSQLGGQITYLRHTFHKAVMVVETAYPWTLEALPETADNILNQGMRLYGISPEGQRAFLLDLTQTVINNGGLGVVYWEPAWVSTPCETRWGQGSHWENATFFDFHNNNELLPAVDFLNAPYTTPTHLLQGTVHESYGEALSTDARGDSQEQAAHLDLDALYMHDDADYFYFALTVNGNIATQSWGNYLVYLDADNGTSGADVDVRSRPIAVTAVHRPELRLDIGIVTENGTLGGDFILNAWNGTEWEEVAFTGATAVTPGNPSIIEWQLPKAQWQYADTIWVSVVSVGRGRNHTAADILGSEPSPQQWTEPVTLTTFLPYKTAVP